MMKRIGTMMIGLLAIGQLHAQNKYQYSLDLGKVDNDKVTVSLEVPRIAKDSILFHMPKMVPGTYAIENYGSYIENLKAYDAKGKELVIERKDKNSWMIRSAKTLRKISYAVNDTWDSPEIKEDIFEPAGTNISKDTFFVMNTFGFFGYFEGMELLPFEVSITKPEYLYGATSLERTKATTPTRDVFTTTNYHYLADAPIMYAKADTAYLQVSKTKVLVAVYSPGKVVTAKGVAGELLPVLKAQEKYLNGKLPVDRYAFLIHLSDNTRLTRYGALEHSYSSMYYLPEFMSPKQLSESIKDVAAHEFFHIITPLNVHSEEIGNFNYIQPEMSQHLWMYEGLTEYAAHHAQVRGGLITQEEYLARMAGKIKMSRTRYNDTLPFTEMSKQALGKYKLQYENVYQKGALIGLCLDLSLLNLSNGKYGTRELMEDLGKTYGKDKSFKDDELFTIIGQKTYPQIESFLRTYVAGNKALPLDSIFNLAGIKYTPDDIVYTMEIAFNTNFGVIAGTDTLEITSTATQSALGKRLGMQRGDKMIEFNGEPFGLSNYQQRFQQYQETAKEGSQVSWKVLRKNSNGVWEEKLLTATIQNEPTKEHTLKPMPNASEKQNTLRKTWLQVAQ